MTYVNDPIGDFLTRMRNAQSARRKTCRAPHSRIKKELCDLLVREGWLEKVELLGDVPKQELKVTFVEGKQLQLQRVSKPGRRHYAKSAELVPILRGYGQAILTTSQGLMTDAQARKKKVGGEILCIVA